MGVRTEINRRVAVTSRRTSAIERASVHTCVRGMRNKQKKQKKTRGQRGTGLRVDLTAGEMGTLRKYMCVWSHDEE